MKPIRFFDWLDKPLQMAAVCMALMTALTCSAAPSASAPPARPAQLASTPPALQPWRDWVRYQQEFRQCPLIAGADGASADDFLCAWPGVLTLQAGNQGATFAQHWQVAAQTWVPLPGNNRNWPQEVAVNGAPQPVLEHDGVPSLWLVAGEYDVRGRLVWQERPQALDIPAITGLIALSVQGKPIQPLQRNEAQLTLGRSAEAVNEATDSVELQVYRKLTDGIPAQLTTWIQLQVSGKAREIQVAPALPEHFMATALQTPWPTRLDANGRLQIQAQPGQATLVLSARADAPLARLQARLPDGLGQEVWSYEAAPALRVTAVTASGKAMAVDPKQAGVPRQWQALPAFAMNAASQLNIEERSRGLAAGETNRLTLARELWLDFSGDGYFAKDMIRGQMQQGWRLDLAAPYRLQRANDGDQALLVTQGAGDKNAAALTGVEWRSPQVALNASVRIAARPGSVLPVTGWRQTFDQVSATLHLPYGYKLLAAPGADAANNGWVAHWTILDIFLAAFIALLAWRLLGIGGGIVAAAYLLLGLPEPGAPLWTLALALALALLARALPGGRLGQAVKLTLCAALAVFFLAAIAFAPGQLRAALYPQLERTDNGRILSPFVFGAASQAPEYDGMKEVQAPPPVAATAPAEPAQADSLALSVKNSNAVPYSLAKHKQRQRYAQSNVVQTGAGEPDWRIGQRYSLRWTGPISPDQTVRLIICPPWLTRLLRIAMIVLLGLLAWRIARRALPGGLKSAVASLAPRTAWAAAAMALGALTGVLWLYPAPAWAQGTVAFPSEKLLQTLWERVNRPPRCAPDCASIAQADIRMRGNALIVRLQAHAGDNVALPLPKTDDNSMLTRVLVDGRPLDSVRRGEQADLVPMSRGVHLVELAYAVSGNDTSLNFPLQPMNVSFEGPDWRAEGIDEQRLINATVHLSRAAAPARASSDPADYSRDSGAQQFAPYVLVTRTLHFDLDWSVVSTVTRVSPREGGMTLAVPLLAGEHVTTPDVKVQDDKATLALGQNDSQTSWQSRLDKSETLRLTAPALAERAEVWRIQISPWWHVQWNGVPVTLSDNDGETVFEFHPLPGETLTLKPTLPPAVQGMVRAIDQVGLEEAIGMRASQYTLSFRLRASQGGEHIITLPASGMEVLSVTRNTENLNLRPQEGKLTLPVSPGVQLFAITLREPRQTGTILRMPTFDPGLPTANIDIRATLPEQRWLLAAFGPPVGPAVLYWGELAVALVLALLLTLGLTRRGWTSLRPHHWFLLVLGFSTFSWVALALIVVWLIVLDWRQRADLSGWKTWQFNGVQLGLALLSLAALACLIAVIPNGLLGMPNMGVAGHGSSGNQLNWFADQSQTSLPAVTIVSLPMWAYRAAMLAWALWLAWAVIGWLRRGLTAWMQGGYWRKINLRKLAKASKTPEPPPAPQENMP